MAYVGNQPARGQWRKLTDISASFNGVLTTFTTSVPPGTSEYYVTAGSASQLIVSLGGVIQQPDLDYTVSTNSITFTTAPAGGLSFFAVLGGDALNTGTPSDGSVTTAKLAGGLSVGLGAGTVTTPSLFFTGDVNTGLYSPTADTIAFAEGGVEAMRIDSSGRVGIGTNAPNRKLDVSDASADNFIRVNTTGATKSGIEFASGGTAYSQMYFNNVAPYDLSLLQQYTTGSLILGTNSTERARIDSSGRLLVGTSTGSSVFDGVTPQFQVEGTSFNTSSASIFTNSNDANGAYFIIGKSRGTATGSSTIVSNNDTIGGIDWVAADGTDRTTPLASIFAAVDGTPGANDMPGRLVFSTSADGASSPTEAFRINNFQKPIFGGPTIRCLGTYNSTTASAANQFVDSAGDFYRSTSSIKYKTNVETIEDHYSNALLQCHPVWYQSTCEADNPDWGHWGFIAEEVAQIDPRLCFFKEEEDGSLEPEGVQYDRFVPHLLNLIKRQQQAIETLEAKVAALESA